MSCQETLYRTLREKGMRVTPQREIVVSVLHDVEDHSTVDEIYRRVQGHSSVIDVSTVYRTLEMLGAMSMLDVLEGADGQRRYALRHTHDLHVHLVCTECGGAVEVDAGPVTALAQSLRQAYGFILDDRHLTLSGRCARCHAGVDEPQEAS
jgi:Fur family transcriptional regulator, ferric uptake regulator